MDTKKGESKEPVKSNEGTKIPKDGINKKGTADKEPADKKSDSKKPKTSQLKNKITIS